MTKAELKIESDGDRKISDTLDEYRTHYKALYKCPVYFLTF